MEVVNQQLEVDNNHGSECTTSSFSKEEELRQLMIHLYKKSFADDNYDGSGGSKSSIGEYARVNAYKEPEMELLSRIYNETICPMIFADITAKHQNFLSLVREKFGCDSLTGVKWDFCNPSSSVGSKALELRFLNEISVPVATGMHIEGKDNNPFVLALVDVISGEIVKAGAGSSMEIEIVVLEGDSTNDESENWTSDEFNSKIVSEWNGKKVLQGETFVKMKEGVVLLDKISFTHNKDWKENKHCRLGARSVNADFSASVKAGKTELFLVEDKRTRKYRKHAIPFLSDHVYRLAEISHRADRYKRLCDANIKTVMDLLILHAINPNRLKDILKVHPNTLKTIIDHAQKCKDDKGVYLYHHPRDGQKSHGVIFNISRHLMGLVADSQFVPCDKLPMDKREFAKGLVISAFKNWKDVITINKYQFVARSSTNLLNKSVFLNGLDLNIDESSLFDNMLSVGQHPNPQFLPESLRTRYNEIYFGIESALSSNQHQSWPCLGLVGTKVDHVNRSGKRWRVLFCVVVTITIGSLPKKCSEDSHVHKKRKLS